MKHMLLVMCPVWCHTSVENLYYAPKILGAQFLNPCVGMQILKNYDVFAKCGTGMLLICNHHISGVRNFHEILNMGAQS